MPKSNLLGITSKKDFSFEHLTAQILKLYLGCDQLSHTHNKHHSLNHRGVLMMECIILKQNKKKPHFIWKWFSFRVNFKQHFKPTGSRIYSIQGCLMLLCLTCSAAQASRGFFRNLKKTDLTYRAQQSYISLNAAQYKIWNKCLQSSHQNPFGYTALLPHQPIMKCLIKVPLWAIVYCSFTMKLQWT